MLPLKRSDNIDTRCKLDILREKEIAINIFEEDVYDKDGLVYAVTENSDDSKIHFNDV